MQSEAMLVSEPDALCWLLNIRGADIPYNPLPLCYGLVRKDETVTLFIAPERVPESCRHESLELVSPEAMESTLKALAKEEAITAVQLDPAHTPLWFVQTLEAANVSVRQCVNPVTRLKAIKNDTEEGMRRAHIVDGQAVQEWWRWFDSLPARETVTELEVIDQLESCRAVHPDYLGASFPTIAGSGEHGAIVHYRATETSNRTIHPGEPLLLDSGGQYPYGTTDITRTVCRGTPPPGFIRAFTLVLKGHIALATAVFPHGTTGHQLDILARQYLWADGKDYQHGTGHGVGCYLCVHEGPQSISPRHTPVILEPGMVLSNEPGYYREGEYGIRIESLVLVVEKQQVGTTRFYGFETLTRVPIDERLVDVSLLTHTEREWLEWYNGL
jgi:Xaa-Pro aminopeptidase